MSVQAEGGGYAYCETATLLQLSEVYHDATRRCAEKDGVPLTAQAHALAATGATALRESCVFSPGCRLPAGAACPIIDQAVVFLEENQPTVTERLLFHQ